MEKLISSGEADSFDLVFIDADKGQYDTYYENALVLLKKNGIVAVDNTLWHGKVLGESTNQSTIAIQSLNQKLREDIRVSSVMLPIADGLTLCRKR